MSRPQPSARLYHTSVPIEYERDLTYGTPLYGKTKSPPPPDSEADVAVKSLLYYAFWPLSMLVMRKPGAQAGVAVDTRSAAQQVQDAKEETRWRATHQVVTEPDAASRPSKKPDTRLTEDKDYERYGVHGQHYWEPFLDPYGNGR